MRILKTLTTGLLAMALVSGCAPSYRETLEQKLEGKNPNERRALLAQECSQEIQKGLKPENEANVRHFENMKKICEEMTGKPVAVKGMK